MREKRTLVQPSIGTMLALNIAKVKRYIPISLEDTLSHVLEVDQDSNTSKMFHTVFCTVLLSAIAGRSQLLRQFAAVIFNHTLDLMGWGNVVLGTAYT